MRKEKRNHEGLILHPGSFVINEGFNVINAKNVMLYLTPHAEEISQEAAHLYNRQYPSDPDYTQLVGEIRSGGYDNQIEIEVGRWGEFPERDFYSPTFTLRRINVKLLAELHRLIELMPREFDPYRLAYNLMQKGWIATTYESREVIKRDGSRMRPNICVTHPAVMAEITAKVLKQDAEIAEKDKCQRIQNVARTIEWRQRQEQEEMAS